MKKQQKEIKKKEIARIKKVLRRRLRRKAKTRDTKIIRKHIEENRRLMEELFGREREQWAREIEEHEESMCPEARLVSNINGGRVWER